MVPATGVCHQRTRKRANYFELSRRDPAFPPPSFSLRLVELVILARRRPKPQTEPKTLPLCTPLSVRIKFHLALSRLSPQPSSQCAIRFHGASNSAASTVGG